MSSFHKQGPKDTGKSQARTTVRFAGRPEGSVPFVGTEGDIETLNYIASFYNGNRSEAMRAAVRAYAMFLHKVIDKGE